MRRDPHDGQKPRPLHEKATSSPLAAVRAAHAGEAEGQEAALEIAVELALDESRQAPAGVRLACAGDESLEMREQHPVQHPGLRLAAAPPGLAMVALLQHARRRLKIDSQRGRPGCMSIRAAVLPRVRAARWCPSSPRGLPRRVG